MVPMKVIGRIINIIVCCASVGSESETYDWFGAQELCRNSSKRLITDASDSLNFIWTGKHKKLSQWIKILGCYKESNVPGNFIFNMTDYPSIGLCQEQCSRLHNSVYAVKASECRCLQNDSKAIPLPLNECNIACLNKEDDILSTECGGEKAFSVFSTETDSAFLNNGKLCIALQCNEDNARFYQHDCTDELGVIYGFSVIPQKMRWKESFLSCKSNISTSQMGKFDLTNAEEACKIINITSDVPLWIGIVREKYISEDQGESIIDRSVFIKCQKCKASHCEYVTCFNQNITEVNCTAVSTSSNSHSRLQVSFHIQGLLIGVIICGILVFILIGTVVFLVTYIFRIHKRMHSPVGDNGSLTRNSEPAVTTGCSNSAYTTLNLDQANNLKENYYTGLSNVSEYIEMK